MPSLHLTTKVDSLRDKLSLLHKIVPNLLHFPQIAYKAKIYILYGPEHFFFLQNWLIHCPLSIEHFPFQIVYHVQDAGVINTVQYEEI